MWKITKSQFEEIRDQEGRRWYDKEIELATIDGIPLLTITHRERLAREMAPSESYVKTILLGIQETFPDKTREDIAAYLIGRMPSGSRFDRNKLLQLLDHT